MELKDEKMTDKLTALRVERGLTQAALARTVGVSRQTVSRWERGFIVPSAANLISLSQLYGVPLDELAGGELFAREEPAAPEAPKAPETETPETETPETETPETEAPDAAPEAPPDAAPAPRQFSPLRLAGAVALAGCILLTGISIGIVIGITVLKEPEKPKDGLTVVNQENTKQEYIDLEELIPFDGEIQDNE